MLSAAITVRQNRHAAFAKHASPCERRPKTAWETSIVLFPSAVSTSISDRFGGVVSRHPYRGLTGTLHRAAEIWLNLGEAEKSLIFFRQPARS
jgi:hypothetical protein